MAHRHFNTEQGPTNNQLSRTSSIGNFKTDNDSRGRESCIDPKASLENTTKRSKQQTNKEEGRRKKEEGRRKKEGGRRKFFISLLFVAAQSLMTQCQKNTHR